MTKTSLQVRSARLGLLSRRSPAFLLAALVVALTILLGAASSPLQAGSGGSKGSGPYAPDMTNCAGFTTGDAAKLIGLPASKLTSKTEKVHAALWICSFSAADGKGLSFSVSIAKSAEKAAEDIEQLRSDLEVAGGTAPFKDKLPKGAYSDIMGVGDEAVWTDVNGTLTVRKANVTVQVLSPSGKKMEQIKIAEAFLAKL